MIVLMMLFAKYLDIVPKKGVYVRWSILGGNVSMIFMIVDLVMMIVTDMVYVVMSPVIVIVKWGSQEIDVK